ncbi:MAG: phosphonopyruvate decarboxylase [Desulfobacteraceae bacterium]|nr:MAG: phosphonopyruvate decarboxylase [Desulfobacteraceae bacterium]
MIDPGQLFNGLRQHGIELFTGVPDSLLKHFCAYLEDHCAINQHVITANEGNAVALAAGYHLSTGRVAAVYMQNSGLGNAVNPLISLTAPEVYNIPLLLIIGWRGEPGVKDEPQHIRQGRITPGQLELMEIPYSVLDADSDSHQVLDSIFDRIKNTNAPAALLVRKGTFTPYKSIQKQNLLSTLSREDALTRILTLAGENALVISTTGKTSREVFEIRARLGQPQRDFLTVGSMGHTASIALGVALGNRQKQIICIDGDGSALMHLGSLPVIGKLNPENLIYILLNNAAHESVGGQPTAADRFDFAAMAKACDFKYRMAETTRHLEDCWSDIRQIPGPHMIEVRIRTGSRDDLGRPSRTPKENKKAFMEAAIDHLV